MGASGSPQLPQLQPSPPLGPFVCTLRSQLARARNYRAGAGAPPDTSNPGSRQHSVLPVRRPRNMRPPGERMPSLWEAPHVGLGDWALGAGRLQRDRDSGEQHPSRQSSASRASWNQVHLHRVRAKGPGEGTRVGVGPRSRLRASSEGPCKTLQQALLSFQVLGLAVVRVWVCRAPGLSHAPP